LFCQNKITDDFTVVGPETKLGKMMGLIRPTLDAKLAKTKPALKNFSPGWVPSGIINKINQYKPDVVHLHWICGGFLSIKDISRIKSKIVWTFHDSWPFTGGCHFPFRCERFQNNCGNCPYLLKNSRTDISFRILEKKKTYLQHLPISVVTPSNWLSRMAQKSTLFSNKKITVIPNGIDTQIYKPVPQKLARSILNLPKNKKLVLFGSVSPTSDVRKGFHILRKGLNILTNYSDINLAIFGSSKPESYFDLGFPTHFLGHLTDVYSMVLAYSAADVFVAPSIQDNLPNTVMESLSCGTPCVAFDIGGMPDMIQHKKNGYLAKAFDQKDFVQGILWVLNTKKNHQVRGNARKSVESKYQIKNIAQSYIQLYSNVIKTPERE
jgi:glycosyltransferase involved in cell wall biosynthesis